MKRETRRGVLDNTAKLALIRRAVNACIKRIEVARFVNPKLPQMADAEAVVAAWSRDRT